nr:lytic transglycosylase domain-containing protein [Streptomyces sp. HPF1205]
MPPLKSPTGPFAPAPGGAPGGQVTVPGGGASLPTTVLNAYLRAQASVGRGDPGCHLPWQLLAAIGQVESGQARGGAVDANGTTTSPILGPVLDGNGFANITDTDHGRYDGDTVHDRAVGPMQFIPSTWQTWGADGNGDGVADPNNVYDAALAAAHYLCADGRDLAVPADMDRAILGYNHSQEYLSLVRAWYEHFVRGGDAVGVPDRPGAPAPGIAPSPAPAGPQPQPTTGGGGSTASPGALGAPGNVHARGSLGTPPKVSPGHSPLPTPTIVATLPPTTPTPTPTATGTPTPTATPTPTPSCPTDSPSPSPSGGASPSPTPTPTPTPTGTATPTPSPTPDPCATATPTPDPSSTTPAPEATGATATGAAVSAGA